MTDEPTKLHPPSVGRADDDEGGLLDMTQGDRHFALLVQSLTNGFMVPAELRADNITDVQDALQAAMGEGLGLLVRADDDNLVILHLPDTGIALIVMPQEEFQKQVQAQAAQQKFGLPPGGATRTVPSKIVRPPR